MELAALLLSALTVVVAGLAAWWSREAASGQAETARKTEWGLNFRAACSHLESANLDLRQLGIDLLLEMRADRALDDDQKRQVTAVTRLLLRGMLGA